MCRQSSTARECFSIYTLETRRHLDRQILPIPPLLPRPNEVAQTWITKEAQRQVSVRGAVPALSKGHHGFVRADPGCSVHGPQRLSGLEGPVSIQVIDPLEMHRPRYRTTTGGPDTFR